MSNPEALEISHNSCVTCPALRQQATRNEGEIEKLWEAKMIMDNRIDGIKNLLIGLLGSSILTLVGVVAMLIVAVK